MGDFNKFVRIGKAKIQCFPGATSNQMLHYLDINLQDNNTESVILHVGVNDVLQDSKKTNMNSFFNNVQEMTKKYRIYNVKNVFVSGLVFTERFNVKTLENIHNKMVILCSKLYLRYIDNRNMKANHLFKDRLHLLESGKTTLANNFISNLNIFLSYANQLNVFI